jgi:hypothetical protein
MSSMAGGSDCPRRPCPIAADGASFAALAALPSTVIPPPIDPVQTVERRACWLHRWPMPNRAPVVRPVAPCGHPVPRAYPVWETQGTASASRRRATGSAWGSSSYYGLSTGGCSRVPPATEAAVCREPYGAACSSGSRSSR